MSLTVTTSQSTTNPRSSKSDHQWLRLTQRLVLPPTVSSPLLPQTATPTVTTDLSNFPKSPKVLFSNPAPDPSLFEPQSCLYSDGEKMAKRQDIITHPLPGSLWDHSLGELERGLVDADLNNERANPSQRERDWHQQQRDTCDTVDPWAVEFEPNPVIFAHLFDCFSADEEKVVPEVTEKTQLELPIQRDLLDVISSDPQKQDREKEVTSDERQCQAITKKGQRCRWPIQPPGTLCPMHTRRNSKGIEISGRTMASPDPSEAEGMVTGESDANLLPRLDVPASSSNLFGQTPGFQKPDKIPIPRKTLTPKSRRIARSDKGVRSQAPPANTSEHHKLLTPVEQSSPQPRKNAIGYAFEKLDAANVVDLGLIAELTEQVKKSVLEEFRIDVVGNSPIDLADSKYGCPECDLTFPTAGKAREHINRKHFRRFVCSMTGCDRRFHLQADLNRHAKTVHGKLDSGAGAPDYNAPSWICPLEHCSTPSKVWARKDNFNRHVERCRRLAMTVEDDLEKAETQGREMDTMMLRQGREMDTMMLPQERRMLRIPVTSRILSRLKTIDEVADQTGCGTTWPRSIIVQNRSNR